MTLRYDWTLPELQQLYQTPLLDLVFQAAEIHRKHFDANSVQRSTLLSIKTGACPEDCKYCPQSAHYKTAGEKHSLLPLDQVRSAAKEAKESGSTRFCMGAAWRQVKDGADFDRVLEMVREVAALDLEVCCTLGMLTDSQAERMKQAGCYAYNHNLDTSPEYYKEIITTRTYQDRLDTIRRARNAGMTVCCGGIIGMGESNDDRLGLIKELATQSPHPESVPINVLVKIEGTPLAGSGEVDPLDLVRLIAVARISMPHSMVRLSAGRMNLTDEAQTLCFLAGANSIFAGEKLLTTPNPEWSRDEALVGRLGMKFVQDPARLLNVQ